MTLANAHANFGPRIFYSKTLDRLAEAVIAHPAPAETPDMTEDDDVSCDNHHDPRDARAAMRFLMHASGDKTAMLNQWRGLIGLVQEHFGWKAAAYIHGKLCEGPEAMTPYQAVEMWVDKFRRGGEAEVES